MQAIATPAPAATSLQDALPEALALADAAASVREAAQALRKRYAPKRVVVVDAADMRDETPAAVGHNVQLYFAVSDGHCWQVSADGSRADGFYITGKG